MKFVDALLSSLSKGFNFVGAMLYKLMQLIVKPLSYIFYFLEGIFYFLYQLFNVVVKVVMIFVAILQFFYAIVAGFVRTLMGMLIINFSSQPINYPSTTGQGIQAVINLVQPMGLLTVVPGIVLCFIWLFFVRKMIGLIGGVSNNA